MQRTWFASSFFSSFIIFFVVLFLLFVNYDDGTRHEKFIGVLVEMLPGPIGLGMCCCVNGGM